MKTDPTASIAALLSADPRQLEHMRNALTELLAAKSPQPLKATAPVPAPVSPKVVKNLLVSPPAALGTLAPMRPPRPGSLRADIYRVLENRPSMSRSEIIAELSRFRSDAGKSHFASKVHDTLNRPHDQAIERVGRGLYRLVPATV